MNQVYEPTEIHDQDPLAVPAVSEFKKPVQVMKFGNIRAVIWRRQARTGPFFTATLGRLYKDKTRDVWKTSSSFALDELATLVRAATHVRELIADLAEQEQPVTGGRAGAGDRGTAGDDDGPSPPSGLDPGGGVDDLDVPIVTAIEPEARPPDGR